MGTTTTPPAAECDVVVVGARCAAAAAARLLAQRGHDVVVLDRAPVGSDTLSTHYIARSGVVQLVRWGLLDAVLAAGTPPLRGTVIHTAAGSLHRPLEDRSGVDLLVAPRRQLLDAILAHAACDAGAEVRTGVTVDDVLRDDDGRVVGVRGRDHTGAGVEVRARIVVGADGLRSRIARAVDAPVVRAEASPGAAHYAYYEGDWEAVELYVGDGHLAGIFPTNDGQACIWVCMPAGEAERTRRDAPSLEAAFAAMVDGTSPMLTERLSVSGAASPVRGTLQAPNHIRRSVGDGWALVGDAGYHRDPITGQGISDAFRDAELLATAIDRALTGVEPEGSALQGYQVERDAQLAEVFRITVALAQLPPAARILELQVELAQAIDAQAATLAARTQPELLLAG